MAGFAKVIVDLTWHVSIRCMARPKYANKAKYSTEEATALPMQARACLRGRTPWATPNAMERVVSSKI